MGSADCDTARFTVVKINAIRKETGSWPEVQYAPEQIHTHEHTKKRTFFLRISCIM